MINIIVETINDKINQSIKLYHIKKFFDFFKLFKSAYIWKSWLLKVQ